MECLDSYRHQGKWNGNIVGSEPEALAVVRIHRTLVRRGMVRAARLEFAQECLNRNWNIWRIEGATGPRNRAFNRFYLLLHV